MKEEGRGFYCIQFGVWLCLRADPRKIERKKVQNPTSAKIATLENFPLYGITDLKVIQWNPSEADTIGTKYFVHCSEVSLAQGLVVDHAPPTIVASYDKALLWTTKKTVLRRDLSTDSS